MRFQKLQGALDSGFLKPALCKFSEPPAETEVLALSAQRPWPLSAAHVDLLSRWGGSSLDEIRIASLDAVRAGSDDRSVQFASDYSGFVFRYDKGGAVLQEDTDGGAMRIVAASMTAFFDDVLLGDQCLALYGEAWLSALREHGLAT
ncbi:hypothetical protein PMI12_01156 [Variovorax sp. CF313]|uniref:hypothetical protein n=1 Tax=Variovorax sp. CF313 TaxID=1144315 RepID=UPI000270EB86|nr:hypothetical protein [Variovorax sp. CF313]EJL78556.1 hypothetical protein PMI12_01156 [Variovorax sp. CF313]